MWSYSLSKTDKVFVIIIFLILFFVCRSNRNLQFPRELLQDVREDFFPLLQWTYIKRSIFLID